MALDRQSIERRDFPIARRGYEIEAVDAHLALLADEYEQIARRGRAATAGGLAASAADQVRMIVEAAEQSAAEIEREAQLEARQLRQDAREEAERVRGDAGRQAREHVTRVAEVARGLLDRVEAMDRELGGLLEGVRAGTQRLSADLSLLQASVEEVREAASASAPEAEPPESPADGAAPAPAAEGDDDAAEGDDEVQADRSEPDAGLAADGRDDGTRTSARRAPLERPTPHEPVPDLPLGLASAAAGEPAAWEPPPPPPPSGERDGARMVALNMALNGVSREDTQVHIEQNFDLHDVGSLLDEVYARAGR